MSRGGLSSVRRSGTNNWAMKLPSSVRNHFSFENKNYQKLWTTRELKLIGQISEAICKLILTLWWPGKFWNILDLFQV